MFAKRIAIGAVGLALPLALTATPASATDGHGDHHDDEASIEIVKVKIVDRHKAKVNVEFECEGYAKIKVVVRQHHAKYSGHAWVDCDEDEADVYVYRQGYKKLKAGKDAYVAAYLKEKGHHGDTAEDHETVEVRGGHGHHH
ncbi:MAG TPA: hypothetical protein VEQ66_07650 [Propionibacteriaceae bacterium]|nr:hypothetical protein [Propionibacteriaceae bacterium]